MGKLKPGENQNEEKNENSKDSKPKKDVEPADSEKNKLPITSSILIEKPEPKSELFCFIHFHIFIEQKQLKDVEEMYIKFFTKQKKYYKSILSPTKYHPRVYSSTIRCHIAHFEKSRRKEYQICLKKKKEEKTKRTSKRNITFPDFVLNEKFNIFSYFSEQQTSAGMSLFYSSHNSNKNYFLFFLDYIFERYSAKEEEPSAIKRIINFDFVFNQLKMVDFTEVDVDFTRRTYYLDTNRYLSALRNFIQNQKSRSAVHITYLYLMLGEYKSNKYSADLDLSKLLVILDNSDYFWMEKVYMKIPTKMQIKFTNGLQELILQNVKTFNWGMTIPFLKKHSEYLYKKVLKTTVTQKSFSACLKTWKSKFQNFVHMDDATLNTISEAFIEIAPSVNAVFEIYDFLKIFNKGDEIFLKIFARIMPSAIKLKTKTLQKIAGFIKKTKFYNLVLFKNFMLLSHDFEIMDISFLCNFFEDFLKPMKKEIKENNKTYIEAVTYFLHTIFVNRMGYCQKKDIQFVLKVWIVFTQHIEDEVEKKKIQEMFSSTYTLKTRSNYNILKELIDLQEKKELKEMSEILQKIIMKKINVTDLKNSKDITQFIEILTKRKAADLDDVGEKILERIIDNFGEITVQNIIKNSKIWHRILKHNWKDKKNVGKMQFVKKMSYAKNLITNFLENFIQEKLTLEEMGILCGGSDLVVEEVNDSSKLKEHLLSIEKLVSTTNLKIKDLKKRITFKRMQYNSFFTNIRLLNSFFQQFLQSDGIECNEVKVLLDDLKIKDAIFLQQYDKIIKIPYMKHLTQLEECGESSLFLQFWNQKVNDALQLAGESLTVNEIFQNVYPETMRIWNHYFLLFKDQEITLKEIEGLFKSMNNLQIQKELEILFKTNGYTSKMNIDLDLIQKCINYGKNKESIPYLLDCFKHFQPIFSSDIVNNSDFKALKSFYENIQTKWANEKLKNILEIFKVLEDMLGNWGENDIRLCFVLHDAEDLIKWLLDHKDNSSYNELLKVSRGITNDQILIHSFVALTEARNFLFPLLYPGKKYDSILQITKRIKEVNSKVKDCLKIHKSVSFVKTNFSKLLTIFQEKTRSIGINTCIKFDQIFTQGKYHVRNNHPLECILPTEKLLISDLDDIMTILYNTKIPDEVKEKYGDIEAKFKIFSKQLEILSKIEKCVNDLNNFGYYSETTYNKQFPLISCMEKNSEENLFDEMKKLDKGRIEWKKFIRFIRGTYYFINNFNMKEISKLVGELNNYTNSAGYHYNENIVFNFLRLIKGNITESIKNLLLNKWTDNVQKMKGTGSVQAGLLRLASILDDIFKFIDPDRKPIKLPFKASDLLSQHKSNIVILSSTEEEVEQVILSIFLRIGRKPEKEEILICDEDTTFEDIMNLMFRWKKAKKFLREERRYVLGNIHLIPYRIQCEMVDFLKSVLPAKDGSTLILVSSYAEKQRLINAFSSHFWKGSRIQLKDNELKKAYEIICSSGLSENEFNVRCFSSKIPGSGKTSKILSQVFQCGQNYGTDLNYVLIPFRESINFESVIDRMNMNSAILPIKAFHFSLSAFVDKKINSLLFEVIVMGNIRERKKCKVFHKSDIEYVFIEVPRSPNIDNIPILQLLPTEECDVIPNNLMHFTYYIVEKGNDFVVNKKRNEKIQYVCKYLDAYSNGMFKKSIEFDPNGIPNLPDKRCFELLSQYTDTKSNQPSFAIFSNFVDFTYPQFVKITYHPILSPNISHDDLEEFKQLVINVLLESSKDFGVRNIRLSFEEDFSKRFKTMKKWSDSHHVVLILGEQSVNIVSLKPQEVMTKFSPSVNLTNALIANHLDINFDFEHSVKTIGVLRTEVRCLGFLRDVAGIEGWNPDFEISEHIGKYKDFVLTPDNMLKMIAIVSRFKNNLPVLISGETGCGKSYLVEFMCKLLYYQLRKITCHGGMGERDLIIFMESAIYECKATAALQIVVFLDEINTTNCMGLFKEIICDRKLNGFPLPNNLKIIAAINPYRKRDESLVKEFQSVGLKQKKQKKDPLGDLVYRVYPISDSFVDHLFDFGFLPKHVEESYCRSMISKKFGLSKDLKGIAKEVYDLFVTLICESQTFLRKILNEISVTSLRDIERCIKIFLFLNEDSRDIRNGDIKIDPTNVKNILANFLIAISFVYHSRLTRNNRNVYLKHIYSQIWKENQLCRQLQSVLSVEEFKTILRTKYEYFAERMNPPEGIAINEALSENIFMLFLSILNGIPIFIVGPPGSSKSLAITLLSKSLKGAASSNEFTRNKPSIELFTYQCSPISTAESISSVFNTARSYAKESNTHSKVGVKGLKKNKSTICCVLLDEISLAELSPHLPLKVLHKELDQTVSENLVSVIGISNYSLDSAKMNRAIYLLRSTPTTEDLKITAQGIVNNPQLKNLLNSLAIAYKKVYDTQALPNYWGLREFYYLIKYINQRHNHGYVQKELLLESVLRNFGGRPQNELENVLKIFENETGLDIVTLKRPSTIELIKANISDRDSRHMMLLTINNAALHLLFDLDIIKMKKCDIIFASDFPEDKTSQKISLYLKRIKLAMQNGLVVILVHCDELYESLYDLLNQHYVEVQGRKYANIALGHSTQSYYVDPNFKLICIVEENEAYTKLPAPFLNRLEKRIFYRGSILSEKQKSTLRELENWVEILKQQIGGSGRNTGLFKGCHKNSLVSLVMTQDEKMKKDVEGEQDTNISSLTNQLIQVMSPESVILSNDRSIFDTYFTEQNHCDLVDFLDKKMSSTDDSIMSIVMTYTPLSIEIKTMVKSYLDEKKKIPLKCLQLHEITNSTDLTNEIEWYFKNEEKEETFLLLLCDALDISVRKIQYLQYECESKKVKFMKNTNQEGKKLKKHVLLVINFVRNNPVFSFDFDKRWSYTFIDDIRRGGKSLQLMKMSLFDIINTINLEELLKNNLHNAISKLRFLKGDITVYIERLKKLLNEDEIFTKILLHKLKSLIKLYPNQKRWFSDVARNERDLVIHGTFKEALNHFVGKICSVNIAAILWYIDKNRNLDFLYSSGTMGPKYKKIFLEIFNSLKAGLIYPIVQQINSRGFIEMVDKNKLNFPFSYMICEYVQSLKFFTFDDDDTVIEFLKKQFSLLECKALEEPIEDNEILESYIQDYQLMYHRKVDEIPRSNELTKCLMQFEVRKVKNPTLSLYTSAYWSVQRKLNIFVPLFRVMENIMDEFFQKSEDCESLEKVLCDIALGVLTPSNFTKWDESTIKKFLVLFEDTKLPISQLLYNKEVKNSWKKITFFYYFLRDAAMKQELKIEAIEKFWEKISGEDIQFNSENSFFFLIESLSSVIIQAREEEEFECCVCFEIPQNMKKVICQNVYVCEGECLNTLIPNGNCTMCRKKVDLKTHVVDCSGGNEKDVSEMKIKEDSFKKDASVVIEKFINEFCLSLEEDPKLIDDDLLKIIVKFIFKNKIKSSKETKKLLKFEINDSSKISILRRILKISKGRKFLEERLVKNVNTCQCLDCDVSKLLIKINEDYLNSELKQIDKIILYYDREIKKKTNESNSRKLKKFAFGKFVIKRYVKSMVDKQLEKIVSEYFKFNELFVMYFFREFTSQKGIISLRQNLINNKFNGMSAMKSWLKNNKKKVNAFISTKQRKSNPFLRVFKDYGNCEKALLDLHLNNEKKGLDDFLRGNSQGLATFFCAIFETITLNYMNVQTQNIKNLTSYIRKKSMIDRYKKQLFQLLVDNNLPWIKITKDTDYSQIFKTRVIIHIVSMTLRNDKKNFFNQVMWNTKELVNSFFPSMPEDMISSIRKAFKGGRFYVCPNGHSYYVGECGKPMEKSKCNVCGAEIGGRNHVMINTNKIIDEKVDRSLKNYHFIDSDSDTHARVRSLSPKYFKTFQLFLHSIFLCMSKGGNFQAIAHGGNRAKGKEFYYDFFEKDWKGLKKLLDVNDEDLGLLLHKPIQNFLLSSKNNLPRTPFTDKNVRKNWEDSFIKELKMKKIFEANNVRREAKKEIQKIRDDMKKINETIEEEDLMEQEILEKLTIPDFDINTRKFYLPRLFSVNRQFSPYSFIEQYKDNDNYKILQKYAQNEELLPSLKFLPRVFHFYRLLDQKFNRRISREEAQKLTMKKVLESLNDTREKHVWKTCFHDFACCWNIIWKFVDQYKCLTIPSIYKGVNVDEKTPIALFLPNEKNESICSLGFITKLVNVHNGILMDIKDIGVVSSRYFKKVHAINYRREEFFDFIRDHLEDVKTIEQYIKDKLFSNKSLIELELVSVDFIHEMRTSSIRDNFKKNIKQEPLDDVKKIVMTGLVSMITKRDMYKLIEMAMTFLQTSSSQYISPDLRFYTYLQNNLLLDEDKLGKTFRDETLKRVVRLKHLDKLWETLEKLLTNDVFFQVEKRYKQNLTEEQLEKIKPEVIKKFDLKEMMKPFKDFILNNLTSIYIGTDTSLKETLGFIAVNEESYETLSDRTWFRKHFPEIFKCSHCLEVFKVLEQYVQQKNTL